MESIDTYSKSNPALSAIVIWNFIKSYTEENDNGCELPIIYAILPIILSSKLESSFDKTNINTGFFRWLNNNPQIINQLNERVIGTKLVTKKAFVFAISTGIIAFEGKIHLKTCDDAFKKIPNIPKSKEQINKLITNAKKLGAWMGKVGSARDILINLRLV